MKTRVLVMLMSFLFAYNANYAVNTVSIAKNTNDSKEETQTLELKKSNKSFVAKFKESKLVKKIKNALDDTMLILLIILALLLPPLAVWLKDGKTATTLFWITLILCLLGGGFWLGWFFGGFYGIAILLAILRVLDII